MGHAAYGGVPRSGTSNRKEAFFHKPLAHFSMRYDFSGL